MFSNHLIILAIIQGLTEFIPVSSSGHLVITSQILQWPDQGHNADIALHLGTLLAVICYFWRDLITLFIGFISQMRGSNNYHGRLALYLIVATIPAVIIGGLFSKYIGQNMRSVNFIGYTTILFGIVLYVTDKFSYYSKNLANMNYIQAMLIGFAQAVALMPGVSRSGICISMLRWLGFNRTDAARFAFLMSIPVIIGACIHTVLKLPVTQQNFLNQDMCVGILVAFIVGLMTIYLMLKWLAARSFKFFTIYRILLGSGLLIYAHLNSLIK